MDLLVGVDLVVVPVVEVHPRHQKVVLQTQSQAPRNRLEVQAAKVKVPLQAKTKEDLVRTIVVIMVERVAKMAKTVKLLEHQKLHPKSLQQPRPNPALLFRYIFVASC